MILTQVALGPHFGKHGCNRPAQCGPCGICSIGWLLFHYQVVALPPEGRPHVSLRWGLGQPARASPGWVSGLRCSDVGKTKAIFGLSTDLASEETESSCRAWVRLEEEGGAAG